MASVTVCVSSETVWVSSDTVAVSDTVWVSSDTVVASVTVCVSSETVCVSSDTGWLLTLWLCLFIPFGVYVGLTVVFGGCSFCALDRPYSSVGYRYFLIHLIPFHGRTPTDKIILCPRRSGVQSG